MAPGAQVKVDPEARANADKLYSECLSKPDQQTWKSNTLLALNVVPDANALLSATDILLKESKFQLIQTEGTGAAFSIRGRHAASKYSTLKDRNTIDIYAQIEAAGTSGMWKQTLKKKLSLHENVVEKALKALTGSKHIKQLKSARNTAKKTYILFDLEPTNDITGGAWFSEGEIDYDFVEPIGQIVAEKVKQLSWLSGPKLPRLPSKERAAKKAAEEKTGEKRKRDEKDDGARAKAKKKVEFEGVKKESAEPPEQSRTKKEEVDDFEEEAIRELRSRAATDGNGRILVPHVPGYDNYPTASTILDFIESSGIVQKSLEIKDVKQLMERLVYDGQLERMTKPKVKKEPKEDAFSDEDEEQSQTIGRTASKTAGPEPAEEVDQDDGVGYRWVRRPDSECKRVGNAAGLTSYDLGVQKAKNGYSETPCSRCPVFQLCSEGGPVDAKSCEYLKEWF